MIFLVKLISVVLIVVVKVVARGEASKKKLRSQGVTPGKIGSSVKRSRGIRSSVQSTPTTNQSRALAAGGGPLSSGAANRFVQSRTVSSNLPLQNQNILTSFSGGGAGSDPQSVSSPVFSGPGVRKASPSESFFGGDIGEFISGFKSFSAIDSAGRDFRTQSTAFNLGFTASRIADIAAIGKLGSVINSVVGRVSAGSTLSKTNVVGKIKDSSKVTSTAKNIAVNTKTVAETASWLSKLARASVNPNVVVGGIMGAVGSYPFAGFIREEALQTLGFATKTALDAGDLDGAQAAADAQREILNPDIWDRIIGSIPYSNVLKELNGFYNAASIKLGIDQQIINDLSDKEANGESDSEFYSRIDAERQARKQAERDADAEYYAEVERQRKAAKDAERAADEAYWNDILNNRDRDVVARDSASDDYWAEYYKELMRYRENSAPSNLKFGLL